MMLPRLKPFQRVYADKALPLVEKIQELHQDLHAAQEEGDQEAELHVLGPLGENFRLLGQLDPAVAHSEAALALARQLERPKAIVSNLVRLATAYQYQNRHAEAEPLFLEALALSAKEGFLEDYALQHYGKSLAEQGRWGEAIARFEQALALREPRGNAELLASTTEALEEARMRRK